MFVDVARNLLCHLGIIAAALQVASTDRAPRSGARASPRSSERRRLFRRENAVNHGSGVRRHHPGHGPEGVPPRGPPLRGREEDPPHGPQLVLRRRVREPQPEAAVREVQARPGAAAALRPVAGLELRHGPQVHDGQRAPRAPAGPHRRAQVPRVQGCGRKLRVQGWQDVQGARDG